MTQTTKRPDPSIAAQALAEADARRAAQNAAQAQKTNVKEIGGRGGQDPARFGDWEVKGIAHDF